MTGISLGRVIAGGLAAGLIINLSETVLNLSVIAPQMEAALAQFSLPPVGGGAISYFVLWGFAIGLMLVWLYAAIRPRFGPGPRTAVCAALFVWFTAFFSGGASMAALGFMPVGLTAIGLIWGLVEVIVAGIVGAWIYTEA